MWVGGIQLTRLQRRKLKEQKLEIAKLRSEVWHSNQTKQTVARRLLKMIRVGRHG